MLKSIRRIQTCLALVAAALLMMPGQSLAQQDVVVVNPAANPAPVVPAAGGAAFQKRLTVPLGQMATVVGPFDWPISAAITGITVANPALVLTVIDVWASVSFPDQNGQPICHQTFVAYHITRIAVGPRDTVHAPYVQPLLAPPPDVVPGGPAAFCLIVARSGYQGFDTDVTVNGYLRAPAGHVR